MLATKQENALEILYRDSDGNDLLGSTPSRQLTAGGLARITLNGENASIVGESGTFPTGGGSDDFWTHVRLMRSANLNLDLTDPNNPVDPGGTEDELYPVKVMTKADFIAASYTIVDDVSEDETDTKFVWEIDQIELSPLPTAKIGCFHGNRIWVSACPDEDPSESLMFYSNYDFDIYSECYVPGKFVVPVEKGDGQKIISVVPFENHLLVVKESKTGILPDGDPDQVFQTLDRHQGVRHKRLIKYVPKVGICAITTDNSDFKIFSKNFTWDNAYGNQEISRMIRGYTTSISANPNFCNFTFVNGKLKIWNGDDICYVLHVEQGKGWTKYQYPIETSGSELVLTFDGNSKEVIISSESYLIQTELGIDTDLDTTTGLTNRIVGTWTTHRFQNNDGRDLLEMMKLSVSGKLYSALAAIPFVNGLPHPYGSPETTTNFIPDPEAFIDDSELAESVYELYVKRRVIGPFQHFEMTTEAPFTIRSIVWDGIISGDLHFNRWNRIRNSKNSTYQPGWIVGNYVIYDAGNDERDISEYLILDAMDADGNDREVEDFSVIDRDS